MSSVAPTTLVCSMGGVASTMLIQFLDTIPGVAVNPATGFVNPWKHASAPPTHRDHPSIERAVFVFGCPYVSLVSLFRRGIERLHYANVHGLFPADFEYPERDPWAETCARFGLRESERPGIWVDRSGRSAAKLGALDWLAERKLWHAKRKAAADRWLSEQTAPAFRDFADFLARGKDAFRREAQFDAWRNGSPDYPILGIRYESLWQRQAELFEFLQVPPAWRQLPEQRARTSNLDGLTTEQRAQLEDIYANLAAKIDATPDTFYTTPD